MTTNNILNTATVPVNVSEGGTGATSFTAYTVICGGTTTTGVLQNVASVGTTGQFLQSGGASALPAFAASPAGRLLSFQYLTSGSGATFTPTSATVNNILVECLGGGGGGGGASGTGTDSAGGGGGASGGYCRKWIPSIGGSYTATYTVGAGGNGGTAGVNAGSTGSATTFASGAVSLSAGGGGGGKGGTAILSGTTIATCAPGGNTSTTTGGDFNSTGATGQPGVGTSFSSVGGGGGSGMYGGSANPRFLLTTTSVAGNAGTNYGGGGGGAATGSTNAAGGNGSAGLIIIWEFA